MTEVTVDYERLQHPSVPREIKDVYTEIENHVTENGIHLEELTFYTSEYGYQLGDLGPSKNERHDVNDGFPIP